MFEQEQFSVPKFQPMPNFGQYGANEYLNASPHLNYRRHSSYSHEDILNMKHQHVPVDVRYRDSRSFVKSSSNIYDNVRRDFMSRRRSSSSLQNDVLRPFQLMQMNEFLRKSSPTMNRTRSTSPNISDKSNSNLNLNANPSIFIEEYDDTQAEVKSNNSSTLISHSVDIHQPLNEESVAPFAGCDEIPFIDDDNVFVSAHQICDDIIIPDVNCLACNEPTVEMPKPPTLSQYVKNKKTVSFDLVDGANSELNTMTMMPSSMMQQSNFLAMADKTNTCDHITNVMLNKCGKDAGTKLIYASNATSTAIAAPATSDGITNTTNEPIFKFCTFKRSNSNTKPNNGTESFKNIPSLDNDNFSAYFNDEESMNDGQILTNNKIINSSTPSTFDPRAITLDLSELNSNSTNSSTTQHDSDIIVGVTEVVQHKQQQEETHKQRPNPSTHTYPDKFAYIPVHGKQIASPIETKCMFGSGKVKALRNYFEQLKMPRLSKSSPDLSKGSNKKLTSPERQKVLDQLKIWSEFGTIEKSNDSINERMNKHLDPVTRSVLNLTVTATFDEHEHTSKIQLMESERSSSEPNINISTGATSNANQHKKFPESYIVRKQKITTNIQTMENCAQSCPNLHCQKVSSKADNSIFNSKLKASIYNSPCHRSTYLTLRKIKQNKKANKLTKSSKSGGSGTFGQSGELNSNDSNGGDEAR